MSFKEAFNKKNILNFFLLSLSIFIWVYFFVSSQFTLDLFIIFDINSIINTVFTLNFLFFLIFFPLPTIMVIALSFKDDTKANIFKVFFSFLFAVILVMVLFKLDFIFLLFFIFYIILHMFISFLATKKYLENSDKKIITIASYVTKNIPLFLSIILFLVVFIELYPQQEIKAEQLEIGVVNLFVGDDISGWVDASYTINRQCTITNLAFITSSKEYEALLRNNDRDVVEFVSFIDMLNEESSKKKSSKEVSELFPDLSGTNVKIEVLKSIKSIPIMKIFESYFAFIFAFITVSFVYFYFSIAFLMSSIFIVLFYNIFNFEGKKDE